MNRGDVVDALFDTSEQTRNALSIARAANCGDVVVELQNALLCIEKAIIAAADGLTFADLIERRGELS